MSNNFSKIKHLAIAGNIGAGKTSLSEMLAHHYHWNVHYEDAETNPYLNDFYNDMHRWSFNLQIYFLNSRYQQILNIQQGNETVGVRIQLSSAFIVAAFFCDVLFASPFASKFSDSTGTSITRLLEFKFQISITPVVVGHII